MVPIKSSHLAEVLAVSPRMVDRWVTGGFVPALNDPSPGRGKDRLFGFSGLVAAAVITKLRSNALPLNVVGTIAQHVAGLGLPEDEVPKDFEPGFLVVAHDGSLSQVVAGQLETFLRSAEYGNEDAYVVDLRKFTKNVHSAAQEVMFYGRKPRGRKRGVRRTYKTPRRSKEP